WLSDLVSNRRGHSVSGHESRLTLTTLSEDRLEQLRVDRLNLVQQNRQNERTGYETDDPDRIPTDAESEWCRVVAQRYLDRVEAHHHRQPQIEHGTASSPEHDESRQTQ